MSIERKRQVIRDLIKGNLKRKIDTSGMSLDEKKVLLKLIRAAKTAGKTKVTINNLWTIARRTLTTEEMALADALLPKIKVITIL